jgi:hypothetical protein
MTSEYVKDVPVCPWVPAEINCKVLSSLFLVTLHYSEVFMSSFSRVLLEEGVEMELPIDLSGALGILDEAVPTFSCERFGYQVATVTRAKLGSSWALWVKIVDQVTGQVFPEPVGCIDLEKVDQFSTNFKVPARVDQDFPGMEKFDNDGRLYGSFIFQMLNHLHERELIRLPGLLPTV